METRGCWGGGWCMRRVSLELRQNSAPHRASPALRTAPLPQGKGFTPEANWDAFFARLPAAEAADVERDNTPFFPGRCGVLGVGCGVR